MFTIFLSKMKRELFPFNSWAQFSSEWQSWLLVDTNTRRIRQLESRETTRTLVYSICEFELLNRRRWWAFVVVVGRVRSMAEKTDGRTERPIFGWISTTSGQKLPTCPSAWDNLRVERYSDMRADLMTAALPSEKADTHRDRRVDECQPWRCWSLLLTILASMDSVLPSPLTTMYSADMKVI